MSGVDRRLEPRLAVVNHVGKPFRFTHDDPEDHIFRILEETGNFYEYELLQALASHLQPGDVVLDIGANIGTHAIFFAGACSCQVIAFEPNPRALQSLKANVELNGLQDNITIEPVAVGKSRQRGIIVDPEEHNLGTSGVKTSAKGTIEIVPLDDLVLDKKVALIKVDIEGKDIDALRGARKLLAGHQPTIIIDAKSRGAYLKASRFLDDFGYVRGGSFNYSPTHLFIGPSSYARRVERLQTSLNGVYNNQGQVTQQLARAKEQTEALATTFTDLSTATIAELSALRGALTAELSRQANVEADTVDRLQASLKDIRDRQFQLERQLARAQERTEALSTTFSDLSTATIAELSDLRRTLIAELSRRANDDADTVDRLQANLKDIHDRQVQVERQLARAQEQARALATAITDRQAAQSVEATAELSKLKALFSDELARLTAVSAEAADHLQAGVAERLERLSATTTDQLHDWGKQVVQFLSEERADSAAAGGLLERTLHQFDQKGDALTEVVLLAAASQESDLVQLRKDIATIVDQRLSTNLERVLAEGLTRLASEIARSLGRQLGELRRDLDALAGKAQLDNGENLALLGLASNAKPSNPPALLQGKQAL